MPKLLETLHATPFQPFTMHLADGRSAHVKHPDFIARSGSEVVVVTTDEDVTHRVIDLNLVSELKVVGPYA